MKTIVTQIRQKRLMALVLFLLVGMTSVFAQKQVNVSGRITDELNEPMIGVSVLEKGTTNGVILIWMAIIPYQRARVPLLSFRISGM